MAPRRWWATSTSRAPTARSIPTSARMRPGSRSCSSSSPSPEGSPATFRRRRRGRFMRAASWGIRSAMPSGQRLTIPSWSSPASSATAKPRPAHWPPHGIPTSSSTRSATAWCCRSCTSTATRSPTRPSSHASPTRNWTSCSAATAGRLSSSREKSRRRCIRPWPRPSIRWWSKSKRSSTTPASKATPHARAGR